LLDDYTNQFQTLDRIVDFTKKKNEVIKNGRVDLEVNGDPIITIASQLGDYNLVKTLISLQADVNRIRKTKYANGNTALIEASRYGYYQIAKLLIDNHANLNIQNYMGYTALIAATLNRQDKIVDLLLKNGADINIKDMNGDTALLIGCAKGYC